MKLRTKKKRATRLVIADRKARKYSRGYHARCLAIAIMNQLLASKHFADVDARRTLIRMAGPLVR